MVHGKILIIYNRVHSDGIEGTISEPTFYTTPAPAKAPALLSSPASAYPMDTIASISTPEPVSTWGLNEIPGM